MPDISQITLPNGTTYDIKDSVARAAAGGGGGSTWFGTCSTSASTQKKVVSIEDFELYNGVSVIVYFSNAQSYNGVPQLNVSSTGAKNIVRNGTTNAEQNEWKAGQAILFVYDGTYWVISDGVTATTSTPGKVKLEDSYSSTSTTTAATPNAVKAAYDLANGKQNALTFDTVPTQNSTNPVTSGGIYTELETVKTSVSNGKSAIASAITDKGVSTSSSDSFATMASNIENIQTGIDITNGIIVPAKSISGTIPSNTFVDVDVSFYNTMSSSASAMTSSSSTYSYYGTYWLSNQTFIVYFGKHPSGSTYYDYIKGYTITSGGNYSTSLQNLLDTDFAVGNSGIARLNDNFFIASTVDNATASNYGGLRLYKYSAGDTAFTRSDRLSLGYTSTSSARPALFKAHPLGNDKYLVLGVNYRSSSTSISMFYFIIQINQQNVTFTVLNSGTFSIPRVKDTTSYSGAGVVRFFQCKSFNVSENVICFTVYAPNSPFSFVVLATITNNTASFVTERFGDYLNEQFVVLPRDDGSLVAWDNTNCLCVSVNVNGCTVYKSMSTPSDLIDVYNGNAYGSAVFSNNLYMFLHTTGASSSKPTISYKVVDVNKLNVMLSDSFQGPYTSPSQENFDTYMSYSLFSYNGSIYHTIFDRDGSASSSGIRYNKPRYYKYDVERLVFPSETNIYGITMDDITTQVAGNVSALYL